jgi:hypothetical protein
MDDAEDRGVGADADGEREDGGNANRRRTAEPPCGMAKVLEHGDADELYL